MGRIVGAMVPSTPPSLPPPPPADYPASYFTGPLGENVPLPDDSSKVFLINFYGGIGTSWSQVQSALLQRQTDMGRAFDGVHTHYGDFSVIPDNRPQWIHDNGSIPCITWNPNGSPAQVATGAFDSDINTMADHLSAYGFVIMLRPFREFNIPFLTEHGCGADLINGWRRIVDIFQARGATNVGFWWTPDEGTDRPCVNASWPGDDYVDWSGCDQYNMYLHGQVSPLHPGYAEFWEIVNYGSNCQHDLWGPRKAFVIGETGTHLDFDNIPRKAEWFTNVPKAIRGELGGSSMEWMTGISFYDADVSAAEGPFNNFRVDHPTNVPEVYAGWLEMCADPVWHR